MLRRQIKRVLGQTLWLRMKDLFYRPHGVAMGSCSYIFRPFALEHPGALTLGSSCEILRDSYIWTASPAASVKIGDGTYIGRHLYLTCTDSITIGERCVLSDYVYLTDLAHGIDPFRGSILHQPLESKGPVVIGDGCFLGFRSVVLPGVSLGEHCVVGANAVVTRSFPAYSMVAGAPARVIKRYSLEQKQWLAVKPEQPL